jgi:hypothetical protein
MVPVCGLMNKEKFDKFELITFLLQSIELKVDNCQMSSCLALTTPQGPNEFLNVNGPLQLGGTVVNLNEIASSMNWTRRPTTQNFAGCIRNLTVNDKV